MVKIFMDLLQKTSTNNKQQLGESKWQSNGHWKAASDNLEYGLSRDKRCIDAWNCAYVEGGQHLESQSRIDFHCAGVGEVWGGQLAAFLLGQG